MALCCLLQLHWHVLSPVLIAIVVCSVLSSMNCMPAGMAYVSWRCCSARTGTSGQVAAAALPQCTTRLVTSLNCCISTTGQITCQYALGLPEFPSGWLGPSQHHPVYHSVYSALCHHA